MKTEIVCPAESLKACPAPVISDARDLLTTEQDDAENRARWLACIERHNLLRQCVARYAPGK